MRLARIIIIVLTGLMSFSVVSAQSDCLALFRAALISTSLECESPEAGQLCYGNLGVSAELVDDVGTRPFSFPGNELPVSDVQTLSSSPLNLETGEYGMALASLDVIDSDASAVMVVFGGAELVNNSAGIVTLALTVTFSDGVFSRTTPDSESALVVPLSVGENVLAVGRNADTSWIQVIVPDGRVAWVLSSLVAPIDTSTEFASLEVVVDNPLAYAPTLRDLTLITSVMSPSCAGVPDGGVLVQAPEDAPLTLRINGYRLTVQQTAFIRAESTDTIRVNAIDDDVTVIYADENGDENAVLILAGDSFDANLDGMLTVSEYAEVEPLPYEFLSLPVTLPSDWLQVIIPATDNPLAGLTAESTCIVVVFEDVNVRVGPGADYQRRGSLLATQSINPTARAVGTDGRVWWRISGGAWVANDVVVIGGQCSAVPQAAVLPRLR